ncbi:hypothetical protein TthSNM11_25380 (plasmid) [Thermus thermophilus]|uniref:hypothetical protein n=1 Tax=Thermus thermophilus TaxID=274 RepID=UPI001FCD5DA7|nr:hypothetical protein [Thermus thermophilus]BDG20335.1 hypothetical protein TthSNM11_25380 [Thermus thermophilus]
MTEAAYFVSKKAEMALTKPLLLLLRQQKLLPTEDFSVEISSPLVAVPWDIALFHSSGVLLVDIKLAVKARYWGKVADATFEDIRQSLRNGVAVLLFIPPKIYLLFAEHLPLLPDELTTDFLEENTPSLIVDLETRSLVEGVYEAMLSTS